MMASEQIFQHYDAAAHDDVRMYIALKRRVLETGKPRVTNFLTLYEQNVLRAIIGQDVPLQFYGGIEQSERQLAFLGSQDVTRNHHHVKILWPTYNNKFQVVQHQDVLGAILALGIERKVIGDIALTTKGIFVAARPAIAQYVQENLTHIANQTVDVQFYTERVIKEKEILKEKTIYVNSLRLDSLISHVLPCNRQKAKAYIMKDFVQINSVSTTNCKFLCKVGDIISIRKFGRIYVDNILKTRRDRFKMEVRIT